MVQRMFSRHWLATTMLVFAGMAVTIRLGIWQLDRHKQRVEFNDHILAMQTATSLSLNSEEINVEDLSGMEYRQTHAVGTYDFEHQVAIRNQVWLQSWGADLGYALLTPLILPSGDAILVQRGWIPAENDTPASWRQFDEPGEVTVEGIIRLPRVEGEMGGGVPDPTLAPGQSRLDLWNFVNIGRIQQQVPYPLLGVYLQKTPTTSQVSLPYPSVPEVALGEDTNLGYAMQWFFFTCLLFFGYLAFLKKYSQRTHTESG
jgi:surfeit locus 1 family protein